MNDLATETPLAIDRVERSRAAGDNVRLRLLGHWLGSGHPHELEALLVVQLQGRRHRFPPDRGRGSDHLDESAPGAWITSFTIPAWAEPSRDGQAALWLGHTVVSLPPPGAATAKSPPPVVSEPEPVVAVAPVIPEAEPAAVFEPAAPEPELPARIGSEPVAEGGRGGPLSDLLFKETVSALHGELEQRAAETARLRGALADAHSELQATRTMQADLETAHAELRGELQELIAAVGRQRTEFDERLAQSEAERTEIQRRLTEMAAERDGHVAEVAAMRRQLESETGSLRDELARAAATARHHAEASASLREQLATVSVSRDAAVSESAGLRGELARLGTELTVTREQVGAQGGDLGEAQALLADARALTEQLRDG